MLGRAITAAYLPTVKLEQVSHTLWSATGQIKELCQYHVKKFSIESVATKTKTNNMRLMFLCLKYIMKKFRICWFLLTKDWKKGIRSGSIKLWEFMWKGFRNITLILMNQSKQRWMKVVKIGQLLPLKWMQVQVELTLLSQFNSSKCNWFWVKNDKNYLLFIWSI